MPKQVKVEPRNTLTQCIARQGNAQPVDPPTDLPEARAQGSAPIAAPAKAPPARTSSAAPVAAPPAKRTKVAQQAGNPAAGEQSIAKEEKPMPTLCGAAKSPPDPPASVAPSLAAGEDPIAKEEGQKQRPMRCAVKSASPATAPGTWLSDDKKLYNKWMYRFNLSESIRAEWANLKTRPDDEQRAYVEKVCGLKPAQAAAVKVSEKIADITDEGIEGQWVTYAFACGRDGSAVIDEYLRARTMVAKRNPKLPMDTELKYPADQIVAYTTETWQQKKRTETSRAREHEDEDPDAAQAFEQSSAAAAMAFAARASGCMQAHAPVSGQAGEPPQQQQQPKNCPGPRDVDKAVVKNLKQAHANWSRTIVDWQAVLSKSSIHPNTQGCKIEKDLADLLQNMKAIDCDIVQLDQQFQVSDTKQFTEADIKRGGVICQDLSDGLKVGGKKVAALKSWWRQ